MNIPRALTQLAVPMLAGSAILFGGLHSASAVGTREFRLDSQGSFTGGDLQGVAVDSRGEVRAGFLLGSVPVPDAQSVWCSLLMSDGGVLIGSGNTGKIYRVHQGKVTEYAATGQMAVTALAIDSKGQVIAGTIPNGKLFRIEGQGKATLMAELPKTDHIWALTYDAKTKSLFAGTGPEGKLFRIDANGQAQVHYDSDEAHILSVAVASDGTVYAGSSGKALLYKITAAGRATVMYDFPGDDVKAMAFGKDGRLYVISNEHNSPADVPSRSSYSAMVPAGPSRASSYRIGKGTLTRFELDGRAETLFHTHDYHFQSLAIGDDGLPYVGSGDKGQVVSVDDSHNTAIMADTEERQVNSIVMAGTKKYVVTSDPAVFREVKSVGGADAVWTSKVLDAGLRAHFGKLMWRADGQLELSTRTGNTEKPDTTWSDWSAALPAPGAITSPPARYFQVRARFARDPKAVLREVIVPFLTDNLRAVVTVVDAEMKGASKGSKADIPSSGDEPPKHSSIIRISWKVDNPDADKLRYRVFYRLDTNPTWRLAILPTDILTDKDYDWDTSGLPEGTYRVKVEASDELANPPANVTKHELQSGTVIVDNTPPVFQDLKVAGKRIRGKVVDGIGPIARIDVSVDPQNKFWTPFHPQDGVFDEASEEFDLDVASLVGAGPVYVTVRAFDAMGNFVVRTVEVR